MCTCKKEIKSSSFLLCGSLTKLPRLFFCLAYHILVRGSLDTPLYHVQKWKSVTVNDGDRCFFVPLRPEFGHECLSYRHGPDSHMHSLVLMAVMLELFTPHYGSCTATLSVPGSGNNLKNNSKLRLGTFSRENNPADNTPKDGSRNLKCHSLP